MVYLIFLFLIIIIEVLFFFFLNNVLSIIERRLSFLSPTERCAHVLLLLILHASIQIDVLSGGLREESSCVTQLTHLFFVIVREKVTALVCRINRHCECAICSLTNYVYIVSMVKIYLFQGDYLLGFTEYSHDGHKV